MSTAMPHVLRAATVRLVFCLFCLAGTLGATELKGITPDEAQALMDRGVPLIDIRTPKEWQTTGIIAGSHLITFFDSNGQYDAQAWLTALKAIAPRPDRPVILVCRSGNRSSTVGRMLSDELGYRQVYHLEKGTRGWTAEGNPLAKAPCASC